MCPDQKLNWLKNLVSTQRLRDIKAMVVNHWKITYAPAESHIPVLKKDTVQSSSIYIRISFSEF
jgi:hypothetical protein